ncbi:MAG TPA: VWA domain-containing protein [Terriglobales bacterium]|nr:VWA domain-containing protein [Terriglobales bacterium]
MNASAHKALSLVLMTAMLTALLSTQEPTFSTNVKVVNVLATVRDSGGTIIRDLTKGDFALMEDGRPQTIKYFSQETDLPLTIGLLVDTSLSQRNVLEEERSASYSFLNNMLREDRDKAFIIRFDFEVELMQDLTSSRRQLEAALQELDTPAMNLPRRNLQRGGGYPGGGGGGQRRGSRRGGGGGGGGLGTLLYDAVYLGSHDMMRPETGRKALIILSDGEDHGSKLSLEEGVEAAQRADTVVYSIYFTDDGGGFFGRMASGGPLITAGGGDGKKVLQRISKQTGGRMFEVSRKQNLGQIFQQIEEELRNQYSLGYSSDRPADDGGYRKISVTTRRKNLIVQSRDGYYPNKQMK